MFQIIINWAKSLLRKRESRYIIPPSRHINSFSSTDPPVQFDLMGKGGIPPDYFTDNPPEEILEIKEEMRQVIKEVKKKK